LSTAFLIARKNSGATEYGACAASDARTLSVRGSSPRAATACSTIGSKSSSGPSVDGSFRLKPRSSQNTTPASGLLASLSNVTNNEFVISPTTAVPHRSSSSIAASIASMTRGSFSGEGAFRRSAMISRVHAVNDDAGAT
jgi:hypothetical protein